jgi:prolyl-tRNA synthetase
MKLYQSCSVFRAEKETNPFLRGAEFLWIETHNLYSTGEEALAQTRKDFEIQKTVCSDYLGIEFIGFERPQWDKFAGAEKTFAYDCLMPDGKAFQFGSTHYLGGHFTTAFDVKFTDAEGKYHFPHSTCYGPGIWRVMGAVIAIHGDQKGLIFPFEIAPIQVIITPILRGENVEKVKQKALELKAQLIGQGFRADVDLTDKSPGFKFNWWEMKGVPFRIELGEREIAENAVTLVRRDTKEKIKINMPELEGKIKELAAAMLSALREKSKTELNSSIKTAILKDDAKKILDEKGIAKIFICSIGNEGRKCADELKNYTKGGKVRGIRLDEPAFIGECIEEGNLHGIKLVERKQEKGRCLVCGKDGIRVYLARQY